MSNDSSNRNDQRQTAHDSQGPLMTVRTVADTFFAGAVSDRWVRHNVAPEKMLRVGRGPSMWLESDVRAWLDQRRSG